MYIGLLPDENIMTEYPLHNWSTFGLFSLPEFHDVRGDLGVVETDRAHFPFDIRRIFWIRHVPAGQMRGCHAHRTCAEVLIALSGSLKAHVHDGQQAGEFILDNARTALFIPAMVWCSFSDFTPDCVCLCLASLPYEREGYINSFSDFIHIANP